MVLDYYKLNEQPFGVTPDPRYIYFTTTHREALASLAYAVEMGAGFAVLIAKPGMGKTTLLFRLMDYLQSKARTVFVFHTQCNSVDLLRYILADMNIKHSGKDLVEMHALLNEALLREARFGRSVVVAIDESQNLGHQVLETIRLLSDFETPRRKLLQIILCGQPQLAHKLAHPGLTQLRQRVTSLCKLAPLSLQETAGYIDHRLQVAGHPGRLFTPEAVQIIFKESRGIPRVINTLCANALTIGCALGHPSIEPEIIREALTDLSVDSLLTEMAASSEAAEGLPSDEAPWPAVGEPGLPRNAPLSQALAAALSIPPEKPATEATDVALPPVAKDIPMHHDAPPTEPSFGTPLAAGAAPLPKLSRSATARRFTPRGKGGWFAAVAILTTALLGSALRIGVPGTRLRGTQSVIPVSASSTPLAGDGPSSTTAAPSSGQQGGLQSERPSGIAQNETDGAENVVHVVQPNETLSGISVGYLGRYNNEVLQEVEKRNADLKDPDKILIGQRVLLPTRGGISTDKSSPEKNAGGSEEGKP